MRDSRPKEARNTQTKYGFYDEYNIKHLDVEYQPISHLLKHSLTKLTTSSTNSTSPKSALLALFPILQWLPSYEFAWLKRDLMAGLTVSILLVPQSLAYATLAGLPPEWGLYASIAPVLLYVIFGTSTQIAVGPVAPTAIMVASAVEAILGEGDANDADYMLSYERVAMSLSFVCGIVLIVFGLLRAGFITVFLSDPVMIGFIMSAAFIILIEQFQGLFGLQSIPRSPLFYETAYNVLNAMDTVHGYTTLISITSLVLLYLPKWFHTQIPKWVPMPLIVMIVMIVLSWSLQLESHGVRVVGGEINTGFPLPLMPDSKYFVDLIPGAIVLAIVPYMGNIALAKGFDQKTRQLHKEQLNAFHNTHHQHLSAPLITSKMMLSSRTKSKTKSIPITPLLKHENDGNENSATKKQTKSEPAGLPAISLNANMEFIAFGIANVIGSFFGAHVVSASFGRSGLNFEMNGCTQISSLLQAIICLLCLLFLMPLLAPLPMAVLSAVVIVAIHRLIKNGILQFLFLWRVSRIELIEFMAALISPLIVGLEIGIFIAIACSALVSLVRHTFVSVTKLGMLNTNGFSRNKEYVDVDLFEEAQSVSSVLVLELKAELSFANSRTFVDKIREYLEGGRKVIIISLALTQFIDTTTIAQIDSLVSSANGAYLAFTHCRGEVMQIMQRYEAAKSKKFPENIRMFVSTDDAVLYFERLMRAEVNERSVIQSTTFDILSDETQNSGSEDSESRSD